MDNLNVNNEVQEEAVVAENEADVEVYEEKKPSSIFGLISMITGIASLAIMILSWIVPLLSCCVCLLCVVSILETILWVAQFFLPLLIIVSIVFAIIAFVKKSNKLFPIIGLSTSIAALCASVIQFIVGLIAFIVFFAIRILPLIGGLIGSMFSA